MKIRELMKDRQTLLEIMAKESPSIRLDLRFALRAEDQGWEVTFRDNRWHNSAVFNKGDTHVWHTSLGWRRSALEDGRRNPASIRDFGQDLEKALDLATAYEQQESTRQ